MPLSSYCAPGTLMTLPSSSMNSDFLPSMNFSKNLTSTCMWECGLVARLTREARLLLACCHVCFRYFYYLLLLPAYYLLILLTSSYLVRGEELHRLAVAIHG